MADRIEITGIRLRGRHGALPEERELGQEFAVDVIAWLDFAPAAAGDDLKKTVNYAELAGLAARIVEGEPRDLIETVAAEIAEEAMRAYPELRRGGHHPQAAGPHRPRLRRRGGRGAPFPEIYALA